MVPPPPQYVPPATLPQYAQPTVCATAAVRAAAAAAAGGLEVPQLEAFLPFIDLISNFYQIFLRFLN
jgi:hypothetical protein